MAQVKITQLNPYSDPKSTDVLAAVDVTADITKKVDIAAINKNAAVGTDALCGMAFDGDPNTGVYSPGADQLALTTAGTGRLFIDASGTITIPGALGVTAGTAAAPSLFISGSTNTGLYSPGSGQLAISTGGSGRLFVDASGNVGVGVTPVANLQVKSSTNAPANIVAFLSGGGSTSNGNGVALAFSNEIAVSRAKCGIGNVRVNTFDRSDLVFYANNDAVSGSFDSNDERLRITAAGLVGIGTSAPQAKLQCQDSISAQTGTVTLFQNTYNNTTANGTTAYPVIRLQRLGVSGTTYPSQADLAVARYENVSVNARTRLDFRLAHVGSSGAPDTTVMSLLSSGAVGIGTTSPVAPLHVRTVVAGGEMPVLLSNNSAVAGTSVALYLSPSSGELTTGSIRAAAIKGICDATNVSNLAFFTNSSGADPLERARIDSTGRLGIGTSVPASSLHIAGSNPTVRVQDTDGTNQIGLFYKNGATTTFYSQNNTANGSFQWIQNNGTTSTAPMVLNSAGSLGIGTTSPGAALDVVGELYAGNGTITNYLTYSVGNSTGIVGTKTNHAFEIRTNNSERCRVDTSGRLLVGTATASSGEAQYSRFVVQGAGTNPGVNAHISLLRGQNLATTPVSAGVVVGLINFGDSAGNPFAFIEAETDGTTASGDYPGRLVFSTTADGAASPTERLRITSAGRVGIGTTSPGALLDVSASAPELRISSSNAAQTSGSSIGKLSFYTPDGTTPGGVGVAAFIETLSSTANGSDYQLLISKREGSGGGSNYINLGTSASGAISFGTNTSGSGTERMRIDSSGRLLVGTSTARANLNNVGQTARFQLEGTTNDTNKLLIVSNFSTATNAVGAGLYLARAGSTVVGSNAVVAANNVLGEVVFSGSDGTDFVQAALIQAEVDGTPGANDMPGRLVFSTTADGAASPTERLRIDSSGRVGIGTTSPSYLLDLQGSGAVSARVLSSGSDALLRLTNTTASTGREFYISSTNSGNLIFVDNTSGGQRMALDSSGRLLVGTSSARANLRVGAATYSANIQAEGTSIDNSSISATRNTNGTGSARLFLAKTRGTAVSSNTIVASGDTLGEVSFNGADGTNLVPGAAIACYVDGTPGANDMPGRLVFSTTADGASSPTERGRFSSNGDFRVFSSNNGIQSRNVNGAGTTNYSFIGYYGSIDNGTGISSFRVYTNGNVENTNNSYGAISDIKLKENIVDANSQWDDLKALQVRNYNFKEGQTHTQIGLVAQEVELVSPGLVSESPDRDEEGNDLGTVTKSVNYSVLYMKAVKALQEAMERIETLEGMVAVNNITIDEQQHQLSTLAARLTALESA
jgi:hypothetical protein